MLDGKVPIASAADMDEDEDEDSDDGSEESGEDDGSEESDGSEEGESDKLSDEDAAMDEDALESLGQFVVQLEKAGVKRKLQDEPDADGAMPPPKRRLLKDRTESGVEGEFSVRNSGGRRQISNSLFCTHARVAGNAQLKLDDLLAPLSAEAAVSLKASTKALKGTGKAGPLAAPLPLRTQDRLDRAAAYEQTKDEVDKWNATMRQIKQVGPSDVCGHHILM